MKSFSILHFQLLPVLLRQLLADKLSCGTRRAAVAAQRKALCKQVQLVHIKIQLVLLGQLLDDVQILVLIRHGEGDFQTETVGQRGDGLEGIAP